jgi:hypothetical protein
MAPQRAENGAICRRCCAVLWLRPRAISVKNNEPIQTGTEQDAKKEMKRYKGKKKEEKKGRIGGGRRRIVCA